MHLEVCICRADVWIEPARRRGDCVSRKHVIGWETVHLSDEICLGNRILQQRPVGWTEICATGGEGVVIRCRKAGPEILTLRKCLANKA